MPSRSTEYADRGTAGLRAAGEIDLNGHEARRCGA